MKTCAKCGVEKDVTEFGKHSRQKDGLQRNCKVCQREYFTSYRKENHAAALAREAEWRKRNPDVNRVRLSDFHRNNPDKGKAYSADYRARHPERRRATCARYRAKNTQRESLYRKIYAAKNKDRLAAKSSLRRAVKLMATPAWADKVAIEDIYSFAMRVSADTKIEHHVDHIVPLISDTVCGLHCEANLRVIPATENQRKSNRFWPHMPD